MAGWCSVETLGWVTLTILLIKWTYGLCHFAYTAFLGSLLGHNLNLSKCGPWAVVTGATDGIGKEFAKKLAGAGLNVVLISRTPAKLKAVADEFRSEYGSVEIRTIAADFTEGDAIYPKIRAELDGLEVGLLVNNVGMMPGNGNAFHTFQEGTVHDIVNCNVMSMVRMAHLVLPEMIRRKKGVIINMGSLSSAFPTPLITLYGATKSFVEKFSQDLAAEVRPLGVTVQTVLPGYVHTNLSPLDLPAFFSPEVGTYVSALIRTLGLEDRTAGYGPHKFQLQLADEIDFFLSRRLVEAFNIRLAAKIRDWEEAQEGPRKDRQKKKKSR